MELFDRLAKSKFRSKFHLSEGDKRYIELKGLEIIKKHAEDFVERRLILEHHKRGGCLRLKLVGHEVAVMRVEFHRLGQGRNRVNSHKPQWQQHHTCHN